MFMPSVGRYITCLCCINSGSFLHLNITPCYQLNGTTLIVLIVRAYVFCSNVSDSKLVSVRKATFFLFMCGSSYCHRDT